MHIFKDKSVLLKFAFATRNRVTHNNKKLTPLIKIELLRYPLDALLLTVASSPVVPGSFYSPSKVLAQLSPVLRYWMIRLLRTPFRQHVVSSLSWVTSLVLEIFVHSGHSHLLNGQAE